MGSNNAIVGCCAKCDLEIMRDSYEHDHCLIREVEGEKDTFYCQHCGEQEEEEPKWRDALASSECEEDVCAACGTTCLDHTSNKGRGSESPCEKCGDLRCKYCPCECDEDEEEVKKNKAALAEVLTVEALAEAQAGRGPFARFI